MLRQLDTALNEGRRPQIPADCPGMLPLPHVVLLALTLLLLLLLLLSSSSSFLPSFLPSFLSFLPLLAFSEAYQALMQRCWALEPRERPTFEEIVLAAREMLKE